MRIVKVRIVKVRIVKVRDVMVKIVKLREVKMRDVNVINKVKFCIMSNFLFGRMGLIITTNRSVSFFSNFELFVILRMCLIVVDLMLEVG